MTDDLKALLDAISAAPDPLEQAMSYQDVTPPVGPLKDAIDGLEALVQAQAPVEEIIEQRRKIAAVAAEGTAE